MSRPPRVQMACSAAEGALDGSILGAFSKLIGLFAAPDDLPVLRRHYEAELYYHLLQSPMGDTLRQIGRRESRSRQIKIAADWLCANASKPIVMPDLAAMVGNEPD